MSTFCPGDIIQLFEIYTKAEPEINSYFCDPLLRKALIKHRITQEDGGNKVSYEVTERGLALIEHIKNLPLPECKWSIPSKGKSP